MSRLRDLQFRAEYALFRLGVLVLRALPTDSAVALVGALTSWIAPWTGLHRRSVANITAAMPELGATEHARILKAMWRNTGRTIAETMLLDRFATDRKRLAFSDRETVVKAIAAPGGMVCVTLHYGNWELIAAALAAEGGRVTGVYRPMRNPYLDRYVLAQRQPYYRGDLVDKGPTYSVDALSQSSRVVIKRLRDGCILGLVCDQVDSTCRFTVDFFGHQARFTQAPATLARGVGTRLWIGRCRRDEDGTRLIVDVQQLEVPRTGDRDGDIHALTAAIVRQFEAWIREAPEQWMWWQRRTIA